jgi:hypothetical protein
MNPTVHQLLLESDDSENTQFPPGFHYDHTLEKVVEAKASLEELCGREFVLDRNVQDATYCASLAIEKREETPFPHVAAVIGIVFSNFGNLFTLAGNSRTEALQQSVIADIVSRLQLLGFRFVDERSLDESYDGPNTSFHGTTWRHRFFDYL